MKVIRILALISPLLLVFLYLELLNIDAYYKDRISIAEIDIKESNSPDKLKAVYLNEVHNEGLSIIRGKHIVQIIMVAIGIYLIAVGFIYIRRNRVSADETGNNKLL